MTDLEATTRHITEDDLESLENAIQLYKDKVLAALPADLRLKLERLVDAFGTFAREEVHRDILAALGAGRAPRGDA